MARFYLSGKWDQLRVAFDPAKFAARGRALVRIATEQNGMFVAGRMKRLIRQGGFEPNAALTTVIKRSTKPLFDHGQLIQAITHQTVNYSTVFVGVLKSSRSKRGEPLVNIIPGLHDGTTITITRKMRSLFWFLWLVTSGKMKEEKLRGRAREIYERIGNKRIIKPLSPASTAIRIPGRPFMKQAFEDPKTILLVRRQWVRAISRAMTGK
jgi:hypothetical protein